MRHRLIQFLVGSAIFSFGISSVNALTLTSSVFSNNKMIPIKYTCEGENISPPLHWQHVPKGTKSLVLTVNDPDAPDPKLPKPQRRNVIHWVAYNIKPTVMSLAEAQKQIPKMLTYGVNMRGDQAYMGPCPPIGQHRYIFNLYALDTSLKLKSPVTFYKIQQAISKHIIKKTTLIGLYQKQK